MNDNKRFVRLISSIDYYYCTDAENDHEGLTERDMLNKLNELNSEVQQLKQRNNMLDLQLMKWRTTIVDAIDHEKTKMGSDVLMNLALNLGINIGDD